VNQKRIMFILAIFLGFARELLSTDDVTAIQKIVQHSYGENVCISSIAPINAGLTNRNYKVIVNNETLFVRIGRENPAVLGIDRTKEFAIYRLVQNEQITPALIDSDTSSGNMIARYITGTHFGKIHGEWLYDKESSLQKIVALIKTYHALESPLQTEVDFPFSIIEHYLEQARELSVNLPSNIDIALSIIQNIKSYLPTISKVLCHQDLFADNFIYDGSDLYLVDWEFAEWSDPFYDLASLCIEQEYEPEEKEMVLTYYFGGFSQEQRIHLEMMCMLYSMRAALWALNQDHSSREKQMDFKSLFELHYQNFFRSYTWLKQTIGDMDFLQKRASLAGL